MNGAQAGQDVAEGVGAAAAGGASALGEIVRDLGEIPFLRIGLIALFAWLTIRFLAWALPRTAEALPGRWRVRILPWVPVLRLVIAVFASALIVPLVIPPTPENLFATLGALGIALGFAFKDLVSSLVAGVVAVFEQPYRQGDWVRIGDAYGEVRRVGLRALHLRTADDDMVTVSHEVLWRDEVYNANDGDRTLMVVTQVFLRPSHDGDAVRSRLGEVAWTSPWLDVTRPIMVHVTEEPWGTRYAIKAYPLDARDQFAFRSDVSVRAKEAVRDMGYEPAQAATRLDAGSATH